VVRVGENSSVSVDVIAGFDVLSINSVPNQTHSSFILCYTHTLRSMNTVCTILLHYNKLKKKKCHYYRIGLDSIGIGPTHTHIIIHFFKDVFGEYRISFTGRTTFDKCIYLYARAVLFGWKSMRKEKK
jgi:hypothetical protein